MEKIKVLVYRSIGGYYEYINYYAWVEIVDYGDRRKSLMCAVAAIAAQGKGNFWWPTLHDDINEVVSNVMNANKEHPCFDWQICDAIKMDGKVFIDALVL